MKGRLRCEMGNDGILTVEREEGKPYYYKFSLMYSIVRKNKRKLRIILYDEVYYTYGYYKDSRNIKLKNRITTTDFWELIKRAER